MVLTDIQTRYLNKNIVYTGLFLSNNKELKVKYLYVMKKPRDIMTWFTTNPDFAEYASRCGLIVTCKSFKSRIIKKCN